MTTPPQTTLFICNVCGQTLRDETGKKLPSPQSAALAKQTRALLQNENVQVVLSPCMEVCDWPTTWALAAPGKQTFTFAPALSAQSLAQTARAYAALKPGEKLTKGAMPEGVPATIISRIPPLP